MLKFLKNEKVMVYRRDNLRRGQVPDIVEDLAEEFLGRPFEKREVKLYAHLDWLLKNDEPISRRNVHDEEFAIIGKLEDEGHMLNAGGDAIVSPEFYEFMQAVLWGCYVKGKLTKEQQEAYQSLKEGSHE